MNLKEWLAEEECHICLTKQDRDGLEAIAANIEQVVKEIRTTDCDGRDLPRFADMLEGK